MYKFTLFSQNLRHVKKTGYTVYSNQHPHRSPFNCCLRHTRGYRGSILTRILTGGREWMQYIYSIGSATKPNKRDHQHILKMQSFVVSASWISLNLHSYNMFVICFSYPKLYINIIQIVYILQNLHLWWN
jgi:hypothetical protein